MSKIELLYPDGVPTEKSCPIEKHVMIERRDIPYQIMQEIAPLIHTLAKDVASHEKSKDKTTKRKSKKVPS